MVDDEWKVEMLKRFEGAETRLKLFKADVYRAEEFEAAIQGCNFVFHVATPLLHTQGQKHKNRVDATVDAVRSIAKACIRSGTVRRLIYTASVMAASPIRSKDDGSHEFKDVMDESCWTPTANNILHSIPHGMEFTLDYTMAKTLAEKELLGSLGDSGMEVVTLACGLVGGDGDTLQPHLSGSMNTLLAQLTNDEVFITFLKFMEELLAKIPIVHIEDVVNAHIFCLNQASMKGRFLCANGYISITEIAKYYHNKYPEFNVRNGHLEGGREYGTKWGSTLLLDEGFKYAHGWETVLDDSVSCAISRNVQLGAVAVENVENV
ncbi:anthocyanidin reductase-like isoform X2 [Andrographis paniculata]|uniref:anthocyanidin reductase-like isoform X2 n=1 Tax=Andrographis paniculata TaxID=175694 RepID=UPI0021E900DD|nr:anthocyanidin reductase-like isoform X2 [Andrographis paniculata]XP_051132884.1 anthocyanidin reductase-like isoform X2 [Andrographis paniculata]